VAVGGWFPLASVAAAATGPATPVAVMSADAPVAIDARSVLVPGVGPSVQITLALPFESVVLVAAATLPPPVNTVHVTTAPMIGFPETSVTCTLMGCASGWPTVPV